MLWKSLSAASPTTSDMLLPKFIRRQWIARPLAVFSVCFLLGIICGNVGLLDVSWMILTCTAVCFVGVYGILKRWKRCGWVLLPIAGAFFLGAAALSFALEMNPPVQECFSVEFEGKVVSDPVYDAKDERIICAFKLEKLAGVETDCRVRLYLRSNEVPLEGIEYGQWLFCFGHVWPQEHASNPYQFDSFEWLLSDGMVGMAAAKLEDIRIKPAEESPAAAVVALRHGISDRIRLLFPENTDLVRAFVLGDRNGLDAQLREEFSQTGVAHLICISGLHISVVAMVVSWLLANWMPKKRAAWITLVVVLGYGYLIGFPASLVRATVMFAVFSLAPGAGRYSDPVTRISAALLAMLMFNPFYIYDGGFVLSFGASAGIILLTEPLENLFRVDRMRHKKPHPNKWINLLQRAVCYFPQLMCTTLAAQLATLPVVIAYFGAQSLISLPVNLLAIPLAMAAYPLSLAALVISIVSPAIGAMVAVIPDFMFSLLVQMIHGFAGLSLSELRSPRYPDWLFAVHCLLILTASGINKISIRWRRFLPAGLVCLLGLSMLCAWINTLGFQVIFLDAEQGDAAVVRTEGHVYLMDVGDDYNPVSDYVAATCLDVDAVFLSHPHQDHAGGLLELLETMPPKQIYVPHGWTGAEDGELVVQGISLARRMEIPIAELCAGDVIELSENTYVKVHSPDGDETSVNDMSLVLELCYGKRRVLFTGDLSAAGEPEYLPDADILKVPHHGSSKACSERLLQAVTPEIAVISVGENYYGHPSDETLERLRSIGASIYRTDFCGAISISVDENGEMTVETYLPVEE